MKTSTKIKCIALFLCGFLMTKAQVPPTAPPDLPYPAEDVFSARQTGAGNVQKRRHPLCSYSISHTFVIVPLLASYNERNNAAQGQIP
jgi:hypothetical protein